MDQYKNFDRKQKPEPIFNRDHISEKHKKSKKNKHEKFKTDTDIGLSDTEDYSPISENEISYQIDKMSSEMMKIINSYCSKTSNLPFTPLAFISREIKSMIETMSSTEFRCETVKSGVINLIINSLNKNIKPKSILNYYSDESVCNTYSDIVDISKIYGYLVGSNVIDIQTMPEFSDNSEIISTIIKRTNANINTAKRWANTAGIYQTMPEHIEEWLTLHDILMDATLNTVKSLSSLNLYNIMLFMSFTPIRGWMNIDSAALFTNWINGGCLMNLGNNLVPESICAPEQFSDRWELCKINFKNNVWFSSGIDHIYEIHSRLYDIWKFLNTIYTLINNAYDVINKSIDDNVYNGNFYNLILKFNSLLSDTSAAYKKALSISRNDNFVPDSQNITWNLISANTSLLNYLCKDIVDHINDVSIDIANNIIKQSHELVSVLFIGYEFINNAEILDNIITNISYINDERDISNSAIQNIILPPIIDKTKLAELSESMKIKIYPLVNEVKNWIALDPKKWPRIKSDELIPVKELTEKIIYEINNLPAL